MENSPIMTEGTKKTIQHSEIEIQNRFIWEVNESAEGTK